MSTENNITIGEFKSWLQGIKDMLGDDWTPNADQWKRICEKIENLKDSKVVEVVSAPVQHGVQYRANPAPSQPVAPPPTGPVSLAAPAMPPPQYVSPQPQNLRGPIATGNIGSNVGMPIKTPSIDTSGGRYDSSFE